MYLKILNISPFYSENLKKSQIYVDYFAEKFVIEIGKDYLCPPKSKIKKIE